MINRAIVVIVGAIILVAIATFVLLFATGRIGGTNIQEDIEIRTQDEVTTDVESENTVKTKTESAVELNVELNNEANASEDGTGISVDIDLGRDVALAILAIVLILFIGWKVDWSRVGAKAKRR